MLLLSEKEIHRVVSMNDMIDAVKKAFIMMTEGTCEVPLRTVIDDKDGQSTFLFMPAYAPGMDVASLKVINIFPGNIDRGLSSAPAQILLINGETGYIDALIDGTCVTQLRTGGSTGAAFSVLAKENCRKGALIGTGGQAPAQLEAMLCVRELEQISVFDIDQRRCRAFAAEMTEKLARYGVPIIAAESSDECIEDADLIITVTPSAGPVFDGSKVRAGATICAIGTYEPHKHEIDTETVRRASKIICDWKDAVLSESGDLMIPIAEGIITESDVQCSLGEVLLGRSPGRETDEEIILYETVGVAMQDLAAAKVIYDKSLDCGAGTRWE